MKRALIASSLVCLALAANTHAQRLAVPGVSPSNPLTIVSCPDVAEMMDSLKRSAVGRDVLASRKAAWAAESNANAREILRTIGQELELPLDDLGRLGEVIVGFDYYIVEQNKVENYVLAVAFQNRGPVTRLLDRLKDEADLASGVSGGFPADTVIERTLPNGRMVLLPAFEVYLAELDGNRLLLSSNQAALESAVEDGGRALFTSAYFDRFSKGVARFSHELWVFGETGRAAPAISTITGIPALVTSSFLPEASIILVGANKEGIEVASFIPGQDLKGEQRRYALAAPPPGPLPAAGYAPANSLTSYTTNHFDGITYLDNILTFIDGLPGMTGTKQNVTTRLDRSRTELGFDPRTDFLANLGPEMTAFVQALEPGENPFGLPKSASAGMVTWVKDPERFSRILRLLEDQISPPAPTAKDANSPAPTPINPVSTEQFEGFTIKSVKNPPMAWSYGEGRFFLTTGPEVLKSSISAMKAQPTAGAGTQSSVLRIAGQEITRILGGADALGNAKELSVTTSYRREGLRRDARLISN